MLTMLTQMSFLNFPSRLYKNYPDGNPANITTTNFAYNNNVVKYETTSGYTGQKNQIYNADTTALEPSSPGTELCVSRTNSWNYVPPKGMVFLIERRQNYFFYN